MRKLFYGLVGGCLSFSVCAASPAVESTNFFVSPRLSNADSGDTNSLSAGVRFPLRDFVGGAASIGRSKFESDSSWPTELEISSDFIALSIFVRDEAIGQLGLDWGESRAEINSWNRAYDLDSDWTGFGGVVYVDRLSVSLNTAHIKPDNGSSSTVNSVGLIAYAADNVGLSLILNTNDADSREISLMFQPAAAPFMAFDVAYRDDEHDNDAVKLAAIFYFGAHASLIDRARKY